MAKKNSAMKLFQVRIPADLDQQLRIYMVANNCKSKNEAILEIIKVATKNLKITSE